MRKILILAGPSAVGKTTVMKQILAQRPDFEFIRSATTRAPRGDGNDGEYIYLSRDEFLSRLEQGKMLEYTEFGGNYYGTPASEIERAFSARKIPVLILDLNGVASLVNGDGDYRTFAVYITADMQTLDERLYERAAMDAFSEKAMATLNRRKAQNREDLEKISSRKVLFNLVLKNESVAECASQILSSFDVF